jgi:hypothetical protein
MREDGSYRENSLYCLGLTVRFLAMSHAQRREDRQARETLGRATEIKDHQLTSEDAGDLGGCWQDWLQCRMVCREVEALLRGPTPGGKP